MLYGSNFVLSVSVQQEFSLRTFPLASVQIGAFSSVSCSKQHSLFPFLGKCQWSFALLLTGKKQIILF